MDEYRKTAQDVLGIKSNQNYNGSIVIDIVAICLEEKDVAIADAYAEGYKKATLELKPDLNMYKNRCLALQDNYNELLTKYELTKTNGLKQTLIFTSGGLVIGLLGGGYIGYKLPK